MKSPSSFLIHRYSYFFLALIVIWAPSSSAQTDDAIFGNGSMSSGDPIPDGWVVWRDNPKSLAGEVSRDTTDFVSEPSSLKISSPDENAYIAAVHEIDTIADEILVEVSFKREPGEYDHTVVAIQSFDANGKQLEWVDVASSHRASEDWNTVSKSVKRPEGAARWQILAVLNGTGAYLIDDVTVTPVTP